LGFVRLYYFVFIGGGGFLLPFLVLFFRRQGLTGTEIGALSTVGGLASLISAPLWGQWMDGARHPRWVLQGALVATGLAGLGLSRPRALFAIAGAYTAHALFSAGLEPLSNRLVMRVTAEKVDSGFGSVRLWGSLGWAVIVLAAGRLIEITSILYGFWGYALALGFSAVLLLGIDDRLFKETDGEGEPTSGLRATVGALTRDGRLRGLAVALVILWLTSNGVRQFEAVYMDQLGAGEGLIGLSSTITALVEIPAMLWADRLIEGRGSTFVLTIALLLGVAMRALVLLYPTLPVVVAARALGGVSFSLYSVGIVVFVTSYAPREARATVLALYTVTLRGLVGILGGPIGGLAFDVLGPYWLYAIAAGGGVVSYLVLRLSAALS
jgi:PPP family 3-phenylpropionic acid transporter